MLLCAIIILFWKKQSADDKIAWKITQYAKSLIQVIIWF